MVQSIKELERLLKLCRKQGVTEITTPEVSLKLGELPTKHQDYQEQEPEEIESIFDEPLTPEELVAFSNGGN